MTKNKIVCVHVNKMIVQAICHKANKKPKNHVELDMDYMNIVFV